MPFDLRSPAFSPNQRIPVKYTCDGDDRSPPLEWSGAPSGTRSYALVVEDPDAPSGTFRHWGLYNIPGDRTFLPEGVGDLGTAGGLSSAMNDFGRRGYGGPCPPRGNGVHHYHFRLAALDMASLSLRPDAHAADIWAAAQGHIISEAELVGTYQR